MSSLLDNLTEHLGYNNPSDMLLAYDSVSRQKLADFLGVNINTIYRWKRRLGLPTPRGRKTGTLHQRILEYGPEKLKDKTNIEIAKLFGVTRKAVDWVGREFGFEYLKKGRRKREIQKHKARIF